MPESEQQLLRLLAVLSCQFYHGKNQLMVWLDLDKPQALIALAKKGWLQRQEAEFALHPVVADVAKKQIPLAAKAFSAFALRFTQYVQPAATSHWIEQVAFIPQLQALGAVLAEDDANKAILLISLGTLFNAKGEFKLALGCFEQALAIRLSVFDEDSTEVAAARNNLGSTFESLGEYDKAIEYYRLALACFEQCLGLEHPHTKLVRGNLEVVLAERG